MMNANIKENFIKESLKSNTNAEPQLRRIFDKISPIEDRLNKDCCSFTIEEIINFYKSLCTTSYHFLNVINNFLKTYTSYCFANNMISDGQNHYMEVKSELLINCLNYALSRSKIVSRKELISVIGDTPNIQDAFVCYAIFEGIAGKKLCDLLDIKLSNFEKVYDHIYYRFNDGRKMEVDHRLYDMAQEAASTFEYYCGDGYDAVRKYKPKDTDILKRSFNSSADDKVTYQAVTCKLVRTKKLLGCEALTVNGLTESGRIDMIRRIMFEEECTAREAIANHINEITEKYGSIPNYSAYIMKYADLLGES